MLGLGYYYSMDERCPTKKCTLPPIYGKFNTTKVPVNTPRTTGRFQTLDPKPTNLRPPAQTQSVGRSLLQSDVSVSRRPKHFNNTSCFSNQHQSFSKAPVASKKQYYNVMWEPKVARGRTMLTFEESQRSKWNRQVIAHRNLLAKNRCKARKNNLTYEEYLNPWSNPLKCVIYPSVKMEKEPLSISSFDLYLTERKCDVGKADASVATDESSERPPPGQKVFSSGIPAQVQTDSEKNTTRDWIVSTLTGKIPEQAILELEEEAELQAVRGEKKKYELSFLFRKWQEIKEKEWNEYLRAWNEIRMREILDQNSHLMDQQEKISVIGFSKNVVSCCINQTFERMKQDGYMNEHGIPYVDLEEHHKLWDYETKTGNSLEKKNQLASRILDAAIVNAVIHRFGEHLNDTDGRPYGTWLNRRHPRKSTAYDFELQSYLENRWDLRRDGVNEDGTEKDPKKKTLLPQPGVRFLFSFYDSGYSHPIGKSAGMNRLDELKHANEDQLEIMIKTDKFGRRTDFYDRPIRAPRNSSAGEDTDTGDETWPPKDPKQSMLQEKKAPLLSTGSRPGGQSGEARMKSGSQDIEDASRRRGDETANGEALSKERREVDNDKSGVPDSESGNRRSGGWNNRKSDGSNSEGDETKKSPFQ